MLLALLRQLLVFRGRASRHAFWSWVLLVWLLFVIVAVALRAIDPAIVVTLLFPMLLLEYVLLWAITVRRLHDTNRSGWSLLITFIPVLGLLVLLAWLVSPGDAVENLYGPKP